MCLPDGRRLYAAYAEFRWNDYQEDASKFIKEGENEFNIGNPDSWKPIIENPIFDKLFSRMLRVNDTDLEYKKGCRNNLMPWNLWFHNGFKKANWINIISNDSYEDLSVNLIHKLMHNFNNGSQLKNPDISNAIFTLRLSIRILKS